MSANQFFVKFESWRASGRPSGSQVVARSAGWARDPFEGMSREAEDSNSVFFGPFSSREEAEAEECRVWDEQTHTDQDGFSWWN